MPEDISSVLFDVITDKIGEARANSDNASLEALRNDLKIFDGQKSRELEKSIDLAIRSLPLNRDILPNARGNVNRLARVVPAIPPIGAPAPTVEQTAAIEFFKNPGTLAINALSGTGKTSTLLQLARSTKKRGIYLAFNKSIVKDAKIKFPKNVSCSTIHSIAYREAFRIYRSKSKLNDSVNALKLAETLDLKQKTLENDIVLEPKHQAFLVLKTLKNFLYSTDQELLPSHVHIVGKVVAAAEETRAAVRLSTLELARKTWEQMLEPTNSLPLGHDGYLKRWALGNPKIPGDFILFDEAQDANPVILDVLERVKTRLVLVGDQYQQIYEWRQAVNAMGRIEAQNRCALTRSFRFGPEIAGLANRVLTRLGADQPLIGNPDRRSRVGRVDDPQAVIARTNAGAISAIVAASKAGRRPCLIGGAKSLLTMIDGVFDLKCGRSTRVAEFYGFPDWEAVVAHAGTPEGEDLAPFVDLIEKWGERYLKVLLKDLPDEQTADVVVSTAHKAKGREWSTVRLSTDFLSATVEVDGQRQFPTAELRLLYVAITRAKDAVEVPEDLLDLIEAGS